MRSIADAMIKFTSKNLVTVQAVWNILQIFGGVLMGSRLTFLIRGVRATSQPLSRIRLNCLHLVLMRDKQSKEIAFSGHAALREISHELSELRDELKTRRLQRGA